MFSNLRMNSANLIKELMFENKNIYSTLENFKTLSINFEHKNFTSHRILFLKIDNPNYCANFMISQKYKITVISNVHPLR